MKRSNALLVSLIAASLWSTAAHAQPMGPPPMMGRGHMGHMELGEGPGMMMPLVLQHANLTPDQSDQVHKIMEADHETLRTLFAQLHAANDQFGDKLFAPGNLQAADLTPQIQRIMQLRQQLMEQGMKTALAIRAVLTPEQLAKVAQLKDRMQKLQTEMRSIFEAKD